MRCFPTPAGARAAAEATRDALAACRASTRVALRQRAADPRRHRPARDDRSTIIVADAREATPVGHCHGGRADAATRPGRVACGPATWWSEGARDVAVISRDDRASLLRRRRARDRPPLCALPGRRSRRCRRGWSASSATWPTPIAPAAPPRARVDPADAVGAPHVAYRRPRRDPAALASGVRTSSPRSAPVVPIEIPA